MAKRWTVTENNWAIDLLQLCKSMVLNNADQFICDFVDVILIILQRAPNDDNKTVSNTANLTHLSVMRKRMKYNAFAIILDLQWKIQCQRWWLSEHFMKRWIRIGTWDVFLNFYAKDRKRGIVHFAMHAQALVALFSHRDAPQVPPPPIYRNVTVH